MRDKSEEEDYKAYLTNEKLLREKAAEDRRASTYLAHAMVEADAIGGRYRVADVGHAAVTGSAAIPHPNLPAPIWAGQDRGVEQPFGVDIDYVEPVGSEKEIEEAARILRSQSVAPPTDGSSTDVPVSLAVELVELPSNSPDETFGVLATGGSINEAAEIGPPSLSNSPDTLGSAPATVGGVASEVGTTPPTPSQTTGSAATTPVTRGPAVNVQRFVAGPRSFRRL